MNRKMLKENAKANMKKNHWIFVAIAFIMGLGTSNSSFSFSINVDKESYTSFFSNPEQTQSQFSKLITDERALITLVVFFISAVFLFLVITIISTALQAFVFTPLRAGGIRFLLKQRKNHPARFSELICNFKDKTFLNIAITTLIKTLYIFGYTLLLFIPGIIKSYEYWAVTYILAVRPDIDRKEALRLSKTIMDGHKMELFILDLSFIGWKILSSITGGLVGILYVSPYMECTFAEFFGYIRTEAIKNEIITANDIPDYEFYMPSDNVNTQSQGTPIINNNENPNI